MYLHDTFLPASVNCYFQLVPKRQYDYLHEFLHTFNLICICMIHSFGIAAVILHYGFMSFIPWGMRDIPRLHVSSGSNFDDSSKNFPFV
jgi:hypothetical protein